MDTAVRSPFVSPLRIRPSLVEFFRSASLGPGLLVVVATGVAAISSSPAAAEATFMGLGDLPGGTFHSAAFSVSADGSTVVGRSATFMQFYEAFRWTKADGMVGLGKLPILEEPPQDPPFVPESIAKAVSADGSTIVGWSETSSVTSEAFRWTSEGGLVGLGDLPGGSSYSGAGGVSADGSVIVGSGTSGANTTPNQAFRWTLQGGMVGLGDLPGGFFKSDAAGVSADGSVIVGYSQSAFGSEAFRWTQDAGMLGIGDLPGGAFSSAATAVSADGSVIVGYSRSAFGLEAFRWTSESGMVGLGDLPGGSFSSEALDVSADGLTVVAECSDGANAACLWDPAHGMRPLGQVLTDLGIDLAGWRLQAAWGISDDGLTIVGYGTNPNGDGEAWIAVIPEPGTGLLVMMGLLGLAYRQRRHGRAA